MSPDPAKRIAAAQSVFKTHDENALSAVDEAMAKETNKAAKAAFIEARAAILLFKSDAAEADKLDAIAVIKAGDRKRWRYHQHRPDQPPPVVKAAASAIASGQPVMWSMVQNAWYGLSLGLRCCSRPLGLPSPGVMGVINMAHGEMVISAPTPPSWCRR
jgi:urea transport system permease protein